MAASVHQLHPPSPPFAGFLRVGHTGQRKLEALHAAGRLPYRRVVFDAAHLGQQLGLLTRLKASGCEIVLDLNFAEMATEGGFRSGASRLPWGESGATLAATLARRERKSCEPLQSFQTHEELSISCCIDWSRQFVRRASALN
jgi:Fe2+ transport system protein B